MSCLDSQRMTVGEFDLRFWDLFTYDGENTVGLRR